MDRTFTLKLHMNGAAFEDNPFELSDILKRTAGDVERKRVQKGLDGVRGGQVEDSNGNTVGAWRIVPRRED